MKKINIAVIGGGASGMMAAISAAREGAKVTIYEGNERLGKKILTTGNGKCNLGNLSLSEEAYNENSRAFVSQCFKQFATAETIRFFENLGLLTKSRGGWLYPICEQASAVLDVLRFEIDALGVTVFTDVKIKQLEAVKNGYLFEINRNGKTTRYDRVIIACGSKAAPQTGSDGSGYLLAQKLGHKLTLVAPALVQLRCGDEFCKALTGVRTDASVRIWDGKEMIAGERGELQFTDYGISGIPVFQLSRAANLRLREGKELLAEIDFLPDISQKEFEMLKNNRYKHLQERTAADYFTGILHKKLMTLFIKRAGIKSNQMVTEISPDKLDEIYRLCRSLRLRIIGSNSFSQAQVCTGGVDIQEVFGNMESRKNPGLYFAGEILDVDGRCGGYNLQWAWTSGYIAGKTAAGK